MYKATVDPEFKKDNKCLWKTLNGFSVKNPIKENSPLNENLWEDQPQFYKDQAPYIEGNKELGQKLLQR